MQNNTNFKNTEIGTIPAEWEVKSLGEIAEIKRGRFTPRPRNDPKYYGGNIPFVQTGDVTNSKGKIEKYSQTLNKEGLEVSILFKKGTILMTIAANIGYTGILQLDMACTDSLVAINNLSGNNDFLNAYFIYKRQEIENLATSGAQKNLSIELLKPFQIPVPPPSEQHRIATALSETDTLIAALEKSCHKKKLLKQAAMQELLKPKVEWEVKRLGEVVEVKDGTHQTPKYVEIGIPFYSVETITKNDFKNTKFISKEEHYLLTKNFKIQKGDILMTRIGSIGDFKLIDWEVDASFYVSLALLKVKPTILAEFLCHYSKSKFFIKEIELNSLITAVPKKINLGQISNIKIELPPLPEQQRIATILSEIDADLAATEAKLNKYRAMKQGMMQVLLTGKIRI